MMRRTLVAATVVLLALVPAIRLAWLSRDGPHLGFYHDDGIYWVTAKSLAQGSGYRVVSLPGAPYQTKYPPVFPALLSIAWRVTPEFPLNLGTAVWLTWLPLPLMIVLTNALMAQWRVGGGTRLLVCAMLALNPYLAYFGTVLMSEIWATCFLLASLVLAGSERKAGWPAALGGLCAAAAYLTKTVTAPLLIAVPLVLIWKRRRVATALFLACALPPVAAWHAWSAAHRAPATDWTWLYYADYLGFWARDITPAILPTVVYHNLSELFIRGGDLLMFRLSTVAGGVHLARLLMIAALAGVVRWTRANRHPEYALFAAGQFALLLVWDFPPNERFLILVLPLLILGLWTEMSHLGRIAQRSWRRPERSQRAAAVIAGSLVVCLAAALVARNTGAVWNFLPALAGQRRAAAARSRPLYEWIARHTPPDATFFAGSDTTLYLYTGRQVTTISIPLRYFYTEDRAAILAESARLTEFARARRLAGRARARPCDACQPSRRGQPSEVHRGA
ncbi:MAG: hypothetical protein NT090_14100 [Acidobacteria bacterium]|nr:hypothetical protein [Acidobacteriota bacterium]